MSDDLIQSLKDTYTNIKKHIEEEQQRINDPCWQQETCYVVHPDIAKKFLDGEITEFELVG